MSYQLGASCAYTGNGNNKATHNHQARLCRMKFNKLSDRGRGSTQFPLRGSTQKLIAHLVALPEASGKRLRNNPLIAAPVFAQQ